MKVGSIVECVITLTPNYVHMAKVKTSPVKGNRYTVRDIVESTGVKGGVLLMLEEICIGVNPWTGEEYGYPIEAFREIEFPPSLELEIADCLTRELETV